MDLAQAVIDAGDKEVADMNEDIDAADAAGVFGSRSASMSSFDGHGKEFVLENELAATGLEVSITHH